MVAIEVLGQALTLVQRGALDVLHENIALEARATKSKGKAKKSLAKGVIIAIVIIIVVFLVFVGLLVYCCCFRKKGKKAKEEEHSLQPAVNGPSGMPMNTGPYQNQPYGGYSAQPPPGPTPGGEAQGYYGRQ